MKILIMIAEGLVLAGLLFGLYAWTIMAAAILGVL